MEVENYFSFESPIIPIEEVMKLSEDDLDNLYKKGNEIERINIFFHLLNQYFYSINPSTFRKSSYRNVIFISFVKELLFIIIGVLL